MSEALKQHFVRMASYNALSNERLYACVEKVSEADYFAQRGAFFGSIHGTLNHILVADRIWLGRFEPVTNGDDKLALDTILFDTLVELKAARVAEDQRIQNYVSRLSAESIPKDFNYHNTKSQPFTRPLDLLLDHFFNHQTHHRGQVTTLLAQAGADTPVLDMPYYITT